ncbi:DoxX family protein [Streptomyces sp. NBC_01288]|uniref:DoxX family membrane protein n=1 Tax=Streptomyces sp. NBC_01288 TaxID=2903814 RepID=UPI002E0EF4FC|nr:DoxX family protein [Streptomyces sp. NBC_01288]
MSDADVAVLLLVRVVVGLIMIMHGLNHWRGGGRIEGTARWFTGLGLRQGVLQAWASVLTEVGAGVLLVLGLLTPLACAAVISVMLVAGLLAHRPNGFFVFKDGYEYVLTLAVVALALAVLGPGRWSVDHAAGIDLTGWTGGGIALGAAVVATGGLLGTFWRPEPKGDAEPEAGAEVGAEPEAGAEITSRAGSKAAAEPQSVAEPDPDVAPSPPESGNTPESVDQEAR